VAFTAAIFSLLGFIVGVWANTFEQLKFTQRLIVIFRNLLGGAFYAITSSSRFGIPSGYATQALSD
jgi:ABC-2 type transport system permease protein